MTMTPLEIMLARKTIHAKQTKKDSQEMAKFIAKQKMKHARIVHTRKEAIRMAELAAEKPKYSKGRGSSIMARSASSSNIGGLAWPDSKYGATEGGKGKDAMIGDYSDVRELARSFNSSQRRTGALRETGSGSPNLMRKRRESERSVLTLAYKVRAKATGEKERSLPGMITSRRNVKLSMRQTIMQLRDDSNERQSQRRGKQLRPSTAGSASRRPPLPESVRASMTPETTRRSRPVSASPALSSRYRRQATSAGGESETLIGVRPPAHQVSKNQTPEDHRDLSASPPPSGGGVPFSPGRPATAGCVLTRDAEVRSMVNSYNYGNMVSKLTINSESVGREGIAVKAVKIRDRSLPHEPQPEAVIYETTHLHKVRLCFFNPSLLLFFFFPFS